MKQIFRQSFLFVFSIAIFSCSFLVSCDSPPKSPEPTVKITIGSPKQEASALIYLALVNPFFKEQGLSVEIKKYDSGFSAISGLLNGENDIAVSTDFAYVISSF